MTIVVCNAVTDSWESIPASFVSEIGRTAWTPSTMRYLDVFCGQIFSQISTELLLLLVFKIGTWSSDVLQCCNKWQWIGAWNGIIQCRRKVSPRICVGFLLYWYSCWCWQPVFTCKLPRHEVNVFWLWWSFSRSISGFLTCLLAIIIIIIAEWQRLWDLGFRWSLSGVSIHRPMIHLTA